MIAKGSKSTRPRLKNKPRGRPWPPGVSGNPAGAKRGSGKSGALITAAIKETLKENTRVEVEDLDGKKSWVIMTHAKKIGMAAVLQAGEGHTPSIDICQERTEGKVREEFKITDKREKLSGDVVEDLKKTLTILTERIIRAGSQRRGAA